MNRRQDVDPPIAKHFTVLVYPFRHALSDAQRTARLRELNDRWSPWWSRLGADSLTVSLDDTHFFLPHIREILFPETVRLRPGDPSRQAGEAAWFAAIPSLTLLAEQVNPDSVLHLTLRPACLAALHPLRLSFECESEEGRPSVSLSAPFEIEWVDIDLFPHGVGFLFLKTRLVEPRPTAGRLREFLQYLRPIHQPSLNRQLARWERERDGVRVAFSARNLVDFVLEGVAGPPVRPHATIDAFLSHLKENAAYVPYTASRFGQVYGQTFHLYTYACLGSAPAPESGKPDGRSGSPTAPAQPDVLTEVTPAGLFVSPVERVLYELATCTDTTDPVYLPHPSYLSQLMGRHAFAFWDNWRGMALHDNVVFLGTTECPFLLDDLAHNAENDYLNLYLLTLCQKTWLSLMFDELIQTGEDDRQNLRDARRLWSVFVKFQNRYWFTEVTRKPLGAELYRQFQLGLDVAPLYGELAEQVDQIHNYCEAQTDRRISEQLAFLTVLGSILGVAALVASLFSTPPFKESTWRHLVGTILLLYGVVGGAWWVWNCRRHD